MNRLRALAAALAVLGMLVFVNVSQMDGDSQAALRSTGVLSTSVPNVLRQRHDEAIANAVYECASLVVTCAGVAVAFGAHRLRRPRPSPQR